MYPKELIRGTVPTLVLQVLRQRGRMYGYEIAQTVKEMSAEHLLLKEGTLYPILHKLESEGHLLSEETHIGRRVRKYYTLTPDGHKEALVQASELKAFFDSIRGFIDPLPDFPFSI